ncbi:MAG: hypothetical protein L3V56_05690 [Candidatus Magnetoovum sp. WYHC-5]|nr:hypothetical protein [Candidatus Magnetoovum sp. WYHC-5]
MKRRYDILFRGKVRPGVNLSEVEKKLSILLKVEIRKLDKFLVSGSPLVLQSNVSLEEAEKTKAAINKTGAQCEIVPSEQEEEAIAVKKHTKGSEESRLVLSITIISLIMVVFFSLLSMDNSIFKEDSSKSYGTNKEQKDTTSKDKIITAYDSTSSNLDNKNAKDDKDSDSEDKNKEEPPPKEDMIAQKNKGKPTKDKPAKDTVKHKNLVMNGSFKGLDNWSIYKSKGIRGEVYVGTVEDYVLLERVGSAKTMGDVGVYQELDEDVEDAEKLIVEFDVRVSTDSIPSEQRWSTRQRGGSGDMPAQIIISYKDADGKNHNWVHGFLPYSNVALTFKDYTIIGKEKWHHFYVNFMSDEVRLDAKGNVLPKPSKLTQVMLKARGWDFKSAIANVFIRKDTANTR